MTDDDMTGTESAFLRAPRIESTPRWSQNFHPPTGILAGIFLLALSVWNIEGAVAGAGRTHFASAIGGAVSIGLVFGLAGIVSFRTAGLRYLTLSQRISSTHHPEHGEGIVVRGGLTTHMLFGIMLFVGGCACVVTAIVEFSGSNDTLLPYGRDNRAGAVITLICGCVLLTVAGVFAILRKPTTLAIYTSGIHRQVRSRKHRRLEATEHFIPPWEKISGISATDLVVETGTREVRNPSSRYRRTLYCRWRCAYPQDSDRTLAIVCQLLVAEPNTLLFLLERLYRNPTQREELRKAGAVRLLRPPSLVERLRATRTQKPAR